MLARGIRGGVAKDTKDSLDVVQEMYMAFSTLLDIYDYIQTPKARNE